MQHVDAMEFFDRVVDDEDDEAGRTITLEHESGAALDVQVSGLDRKTVIDQIKHLPDSMLDAMSGAESAEEAEEQAREQNMLTDVDGETIKAFEELCTDGVSHNELTSQNMAEMVKEFDFEVLFRLGAQIIELSFEDGGSIKDFHEPGSGRSS